MDPEPVGPEVCGDELGVFGEGLLVVFVVFGADRLRSKG